MRITSKGQVTIPRDIREKAGLLPGTEVEFVIDNKTVRLVRARSAKKPGRASKAIARLKGSATVPMTTDEIMALTRDMPA